MFICLLILIFLPVVLRVPDVQTSDIRDTKHYTYKKRKCTIKILCENTVLHPDILTNHVICGKLLWLDRFLPSVKHIENGCQCWCEWVLCLVFGIIYLMKNWVLVKMPSASFTSSRSYVRRSRRKGANRIPLPSRTTSGRCTFLCTWYVGCYGLVRMWTPCYKSRS